jgi:hypothetical protein
VEEEFTTKGPEDFVVVVVVVPLFYISTAGLGVWLKWESACLESTGPEFKLYYYLNKYILTEW